MNNTAVIGLIFCGALGVATAHAGEAAVPFAFADFGWVNGNSRQKNFPLDSKVLTGQFSLDTNYIYNFRTPKDHTLVGSTSSGRTNEFQVQQWALAGTYTSIVSVAGS